MIVIDYKDRRPIYEQIIERTKLLIVKGIWKPNDPLPSVRNLAMELSINPNTIQRAYQELERSGYIYSVKGKGSFVSDPTQLIAEKKQELLSNLKEIVVKMLEAGFSIEQIKMILDDLHNEGNQNG